MLQMQPGFFSIFSTFQTIFTGRNEVVAKVMFLQVCVCPQSGERVSASVHAWMPYPPDGESPPAGEHPPGKQTPAYGLRAAGTHPTGMHSCFFFFFFLNSIALTRSNKFLSIICESHHPIKSKINLYFLPSDLFAVHKESP